MTTTPVNIDFNGIQINSLDETTNIISTMDGTNKGLLLNYDLLTTPKLFTLTKDGFTLGINKSSFDFVCFLQQLLQALRIPPNATTLRVNNTFRFVLGSHITTLTISSSPSILTIDVSLPHFVRFNTNVRSLVLPTTSNCLSTLQYCNNIVSTRGNVVDNDNNVATYLIFSNGTNIQLFTNLTNPTLNPGPTLPAGIQYNPLGSGLNAIAFNATGSNSRVRFGGNYTQTNYVAHTILIGKGWFNSIQSGLNGQGCICIGKDCFQNNVVNSSVAIGNGAAQTFTNPAGLSNSSSINIVAVGQEASNNNCNRFSVALGTRAGYTKTSPQNTASNPSDVAIGYEACYSTTTIGANTLAIGYRANYLNYADETICINATGTALTNTISGSFVVKPIRGFPVGNPVGKMYYDLTGAITGQPFEIYYSTGP
jgi:hypothetical protein